MWLIVNSRLSHLLQPSTQLLVRIFRLAYFLLPPSPAPLNTLKQCLHYDPDSKTCLSERRMLKAFDKSFAQLDELLGKDDWKGIVKLLLSTSGGKTGDLWRRYEQALLENVGQEAEVLPLVPQTLLQASMPAPAPTAVKKKLPKIHLPLATKISPQRQKLVRALCKSYTHLADIAKSSLEYKAQMERWCDELLTLDGCNEDVDGLIGRGEALLGKEEWEEAIRVLERAFESSGRSDRDVSSERLFLSRLLTYLFRSMGDCNEHRNC